MRCSTLLVLGLVLTPLPALSQAIDTNRPGFSFSPNTVAKGVWQLETGLDFTKNSSNSETLVECQGASHVAGSIAPSCSLCDGVQRFSFSLIRRCH